MLFIVHLLYTLCFLCFGTHIYSKSQILMLWYVSGTKVFDVYMFNDDDAAVITSRLQLFGVLSIIYDQILT